jgi:predicted DsbA family dithiol-disulfide isomerase
VHRAACAASLAPPDLAALANASILVASPLLEPAMSEPLPMVIYSDVICPWCYVGKRRLETALADGVLEVAPAITWRPFELNPDMPAEGMERAEYRARKFGADRSAELDRNMAAVGAEVGIGFAFDRMIRTPNTRLAHRLIWEGERQGRQPEIVDQLFRAYFEEGRDIGDRGTLTELATAAGLDRQGVTSALESPESLEAVVTLENAGYRMGITGVPFFILAGKYAISGAQPPAVWRDALPQIAAKQAAGGGEERA